MGYAFLNQLVNMSPFDFHIGHNLLFDLVYERTTLAKSSFEPHLWVYRPRITIEHLIRYMQQQKEKFPILEEFLKRVIMCTIICYIAARQILICLVWLLLQEAVLRATQYLPDIVCLQRRMFDKFHHRIDNRVARKKTMQQFIQKLPNGKRRHLNHFLPCYC